MKITQQIPTEQAMLAFGATLAKHAAPGTLIYLQGELGAGKTTLARGFLQALGHTGPVKSPTYTLIESYAFDSTHVHHVDLYRLEESAALRYIGLSDCLTPDAICLIEWPEKAKGQLPAADILCQIEVLSKGRQLYLTSTTKKGKIALSLIKD